MKGKHCIAAGMLAMATGNLATAQTGTQIDMHAIAKSGWDQMVSLEPCMNGAVSATGLYPSQVAEDMSFTTRGYMAVVSPE